MTYSSPLSPIRFPGGAQLTDSNHHERPVLDADVQAAVGVELDPLEPPGVAPRPGRVRPEDRTRVGDGHRAEQAQLGGDAVRHGAAGVDRRAGGPGEPLDGVDGVDRYVGPLAAPQVRALDADLVEQA